MARRRFVESASAAFSGMILSQGGASTTGSGPASSSRQPAYCSLCGRRPHAISAALKTCAPCLRSQPEQALALAASAHANSRRSFRLPASPPNTEGGRLCGLCQAGCVIGEGQSGYCGLRVLRNGRLEHLAGTPERGLLQWYRDPLPTNCVAHWVCAGSSRKGWHNLAVFYESCTFDCLFCQNWHFRNASPSRGQTTSAAELAAAANARTFCVCFFGGDPSSQMPHALSAGKLLAAKGVTVCWETNGSSDPRLVDQAVELSLRSGGCIKFDLKAWDESIHRALTGASNRRTLENFARAAKRASERRDPPLVIASTLLVPGYVEAGEVEAIARFVASLDPEIPYSLLAFSPQFEMSDLPRLTVIQATAAEKAARAAGLRNVRLGNRHLLV